MLDMTLFRHFSEGIKHAGLGVANVLGERV